MTVNTRRGRHPADPTGEIYGDTHWPLPSKYSGAPMTCIAIHRKKLIVLARGEYGTVWEHACQYAKPEEIAIGECGNGRTYSAFTEAQLAELFKNVTGDTIEPGDYSELIAQCARAGAAHEALRTPAALLSVSADSSAQADMVPPWAAVTAKADKPAPVKQKADKPKPRAATTSNRPKAGSATGKVWDIADKLSSGDTVPDKKVLRAAVLEECEGLGINKSTASVQFGKWWGSKF